MTKFDTEIHTEHPPIRKALTAGGNQRAAPSSHETKDARRRAPTRRAHPADELPDLAMLIGLAFRHAEAGAFRPGSVPDAIMQPICLHGLFGDATARLVVDYLNRRALATIKDKDGRIRLGLSPLSENGGAA